MWSFCDEWNEKLGGKTGTLTQSSLRKPGGHREDWRRDDTAWWVVIASCAGGAPIETRQNSAGKAAWRSRRLVLAGGGGLACGARGGGTLVRGGWASWVAPFAAIAAEHFVGLFRAPGA